LYSLFAFYGFIRLGARYELIDSDFERIAELFEKYSNLPADFADLSLVTISERCDIPQIVTLDRDLISTAVSRANPTFQQNVLPTPNLKLSSDTPNASHGAAL